MKAHGQDPIWRGKGRAATQPKMFTPASLKDQNGMEKGGSSTTTVGFTKAVGIVTSARERAICETLTRHSCTWESFLKVSAGVMGVKYVQMEPSTSETGAMVSVKVGARRHTQTGAYTAASGKAVRDMVQAFSQLRTGHAMRVNGTSTASTGMGTWSERTAQV